MRSVFVALLFVAIAGCCKATPQEREAVVEILSEHGYSEISVERQCGEAGPEILFRYSADRKDSPSETFDGKIRCNKSVSRCKIEHEKAKKVMRRRPVKEKVGYDEY